MLRARTHWVRKVEHGVGHERVHAVEIAIRIPVHAREASKSRIHHIGAWLDHVLRSGGLFISRLISICNLRVSFALSGLGSLIGSVISLGASLHHVS